MFKFFGVDTFITSGAESSSYQNVLLGTIDYVFKDFSLGSGILCFTKFYILNIKMLINLLHRN